ncbi:hypothetical protein VQ056_16845 [Paenibacillus sp. JTLBN-2024]
MIAVNSEEDDIQGILDAVWAEIFAAAVMEKREFCSGLAKEPAGFSAGSFADAAIDKRDMV